MRWREFIWLIGGAALSPLVAGAHSDSGILKMTTPDWQFLVKKAKENWLEWKSVYEHTGASRDNPLLVDDTIFGSFLITYSVGRTIRSGTSKQLRNLLCSPQFQLTYIT